MQHVRAYTAHDGVICFKNRKIDTIIVNAPIVQISRVYGLHPRLCLRHAAKNIRLFLRAKRNLLSYVHRRREHMHNN